MTSNHQKEPPAEMKQALLDYLHLEFGEDASDPDALQIGDLKYVGARKGEDGLLHFWEYPSGTGKNWATALVSKSGYELSTSTEGPDGQRNDPLAALGTMAIDFGTRTKGQKRIEPLRLEVADMSDAGIPVKFPTGEVFSFYAEAHSPSEDRGPDVSVQILKDDDVILATRCTSGIVINLQLAGYDCLIRLGTGPWDG